MAPRVGGKPAFAAKPPAAPPATAPVPAPTPAPGPRRSRRLQGRSPLRELAVGVAAAKRPAPVDDDVHEGGEGGPAGPPAKKPKLEACEGPAEEDDEAAGEVDDAAAVSETSEDPNWPDQVVLATLTRSIPSKTEADARLETVLQVHTDPWEVKCRIGYRIQVLLVRTAAGGTGEEHADTPPEEIAERIGYMHAWRVDKYTDTIKNPSRFTREMMAKKYKQLEDDGELQKGDTALMMQSLYDDDGTLDADVMAQEGAEQLLLENKLIFIEKIEVESKSRGQGILRCMMQSFHHLIGHHTLPEWFRFHGTIVLNACPLNERDPTWNGTSRKDIIEELANIYGKAGGYVDWGYLHGSGYEQRLMIRHVDPHVTAPSVASESEGGGGDEAGSEEVVVEEAVEADEEEDVEGDGDEDEEEEEEEEEESDEADEDESEYVDV